MCGHILCRRGLVCTGNSAGEHRKISIVPPRWCVPGHVTGVRWCRENSPCRAHVHVPNDVCRTRRQCDPRDTTRRPPWRPGIHVEGNSARRGSLPWLAGPSPLPPPPPPGSSMTHTPRARRAVIGSAFDSYSAVVPRVPRVSRRRSVSSTRGPATRCASEWQSWFASLPCRHGDGCLTRSCMDRHPAQGGGRPGGPVAAQAEAWSPHAPGPPMARHLP